MFPGIHISFLCTLTVLCDWFHGLIKWFLCRNLTSRIALGWRIRMTNHLLQYYLKRNAFYKVSYLQWNTHQAFIALWFLSFYLLLLFCVLYMFMLFTFIPFLTALLELRKLDAFRMICFCSFLNLDFFREKSNIFIDNLCCSLWVWWTNHKAALVNRHVK